MTAPFLLAQLALVPRPVELSGTTIAVLLAAVTTLVGALARAVQLIIRSVSDAKVAFIQATAEAAAEATAAKVAAAAASQSIASLVAPIQAIQTATDGINSKLKATVDVLTADKAGLVALVEAGDAARAAALAAADAHRMAEAAALAATPQRAANAHERSTDSGNH